MRLRNGLLFPALTLVLAASMAACGGSSNNSAPTAAPSASSAPAAASPPVTGKVTVFAAASLTDAFNEMGKAFQQRDPQAEVSFNFAGSPTLRTQLEQGARAEIYASADTANMNTALQNGVVADGGKIFARNSLTVITPVGSTQKVTSLADLGKPGIKLVLANAQVPAGNYAHQMLGLMAKDATYGAGWPDKVLKNLVSEESDVKQVVAKVQLGEADAGIVYGTDVTSALASRLKTIAVPNQFNVVAEYPISIVKGAANTPAGRAFIDFVLSPAGQAILKKYGFQTVAGIS
jgi:molybdate transport system substrate-binding protein